MCFSVILKALGSDDLDHLFLKALSPKLLPYYTHLFNTFLTKSTFPEHWKLAKILPIPKTNSEFLPFLSKEMENIMASQIATYLDSHNYFTLSQSRSMKGRSCTTTFINVVEDLRSKIDGNRVTFLVLLGHTNAFDAVDHKVLLKKFLKLFYFSISACNLIYSYLFQKVHLNGNISDPHNISRGVPRGQCLGLCYFVCILMIYRMF